MKKPVDVPQGTEAIPRFAPSAAALGGATCAQQILEESRKEPEGIDLRAEAPQKRTRKKS